MQGNKITLAFWYVFNIFTVIYSKVAGCRMCLLQAFQPYCNLTFMWYSQSLQMKFTELTMGDIIIISVVEEMLSLGSRKPSYYFQSR
jgi:hypothetical protein